MLLTAWLLAARVCGARAADAPGLPPAETLLAGTNARARAFVKERQLRLFLTNQAGCWMLQGAWKFSRVASQPHSYACTTLQPGKTPSAVPDRLPHWYQAQLVSRAGSEQLVRQALNRLVPSEPGRGIHCQYALGEVTVFRSPDGRLQIHEGPAPVELSIQRRYTRHELADAVASALDGALEAAYPGQTAFLLPLGTGNEFRLALLDYKQRSIVVLYFPSGSAELHPRLGLRLSNLASFILVDHAWTFLKNPVSASARVLNQWTQWPLTLLNPRLRSNPFSSPPVANAPGMDLVAWENWLDQHTHTPREQGAVRLLVDGDEFFPRLERRFAEAQHKIDVHICIFDRDDVAVDLADQLKQRSTNVAVKVVFDRLVTRAAADAPPATPMRAGFTPPRSIGPYLRSSNVKVRPQTNPGLTIDHSKIILVDGRYAYLGGMNFGREYRYEWHDLMAEVQGPVVGSFERQFDKKWAQVGPWGDCALAVTSLAARNPKAPAGPEQDLVQLRRLHTKTFSRQIRRAELEAINRSSSYVFAENTYFFSKDVLVALARARQRGVDVRVVMPAENDFAVGHKSNLVVANYLLDHGVRVFFYPGMTHVKALLVDGWACFGSANFDAMSLRLNREANLASSDPAFARRFRQEVFEADFARSHELKEPLAVGWSDYLVDTLLAPF